MNSCGEYVWDRKLKQEKDKTHFYEHQSEMRNLNVDIVGTETTKPKQSYEILKPKKNTDVYGEGIVEMT